MNNLGRPAAGGLPALDERSTPRPEGNPVGERQEPVPVGTLAAPALTVAICTHNRADYLDKALHSLAGQTAPASRYEVLVIDNASTDRTPDVVRAWQQRDAAIRCVREERLGLSHARNRALDEARATRIAYLDDDAIAAPEWVERLLQAFETNRPTPAAVGGPVRPIWEAERPDWLPDELLGVLTVVDWPGDSRFLDLRRQFIVGANMAFDREQLRAVGGFDSALGRIGKKLLSGEELLLQRLLEQRGGAVYYDTGVWVWHHVSAERLHKSWFYRRVAWDGLSQAIMITRLRALDARGRWTLAAKETVRHLLRDRVWRALPGVGDARSRLAARCRSLRMLWLAIGYVRGG